MTGTTTRTRGGMKHFGLNHSSRHLIPLTMDGP